MGFSFFFWGGGGALIFGPGIFLGGFVGNPPAIRSSPSLEILRIPLGPFLEGRLALNPGFFSLTVVVDSDWRFNNLRGSHLHSQSELYHVSWWYYTLVIDLIVQLRHDVIGRVSVKPWCYWLWRLVISNWCVSIRLLSQLNSRLLLVKLSVLQSFSRS